MIQRVEGATTTTNCTWDDWDLVREDKSGDVTETTKYLIPEIEVLAFERGGSMCYLHGDGLSSTQLVTDSNGSQAARIIYGAWGEQLSVTDNVPGGLDVRFVGGLGVRNDSATGLVWMRHRWFDASLGRFISRDPIGLAGGHNLYQYTDGNPATLIDPEGQEPRPNPSPSPGPPVPLNPTWGPPDFDLGCNFSDCIANCFDHINVAGDLGIGTLTVVGAPIPKSIAKKVFGVRIASLGKTSPYTSAPSIASQKMKMGPRSSLRQLGRGASRAWLFYGGYLAAGELSCVAICKQAHP